MPAPSFSNTHILLTLTPSPSRSLTHMLSRSLSKVASLVYSHTRIHLQISSQNHPIALSLTHTHNPWMYKNTHTHSTLMQYPSQHTKIQLMQCTHTNHPKTIKTLTHTYTHAHVHTMSTFICTHTTHTLSHSHTTHPVTNNTPTHTCTYHPNI